MINDTEYMIRVMMDITMFTELSSGLRLRGYQLAVARAILESILNNYGDSLVVMFPRQSGKNELQAQMETYLLSLYSMLDAEIVKVSPTWKPQTENAMRRLERVLSKNYHSIARWAKEAGYIYRVGKARIYFLSGSPSTSVVGATANLLLSCDEAQDIGIEKWDKDFAPMAASRNATRIFWGTAWTSKTLLARELRAAQLRQKDTGRQLAFVLTADDVSDEVPAYGDFVEGQIARLGRNHPLVRTQFFSEEIDETAGMFPAARVALMKGTHSALTAPREGQLYAMLVDVAGEDEGAIEGVLQSSGRDSTALTIAEIDIAGIAEDQAPTYKIVNRHEWIGTKHTALHAQLKALAEHWQARYLVVDSTGIGAGLASFLDKSLPGKVIPFVFTQKSKSDLGWKFLATIETGRYKEYAPGDYAQAVFWEQVEFCESRVLSGPGRTVRWGVPDGTRNPATGDLVHDDLLVSAAMCSLLDSQEWGLARSQIEYSDPLAELDEVY